MGNSGKKKGRLRAWFKDKPAQTIQIPTVSPEQKALLDQSVSRTSGALGSLPLPGEALTSSFDFAPIAQSAQANFHQNTIPSIAERFTSLGNGNNALSSPSFAAQLGSAGAGLEGELARLAAEYGLQKQGLEQGERGQQSSNLFNLLSAGLSPQFDSIYQPSQKSGFKKFLEGAGNAAVRLGEAYLGGGRGAGGGGPLVSPSAGSMNVGSGAGAGPGQGSPLGFGSNAAGFSGLNNQLGGRSAGVSALRNQNQQFADPNAQPGYRDIINLLANRQY